MLGISYGLRIVADSGIGASWLRWTTPLGWVEQLRPLTSPRPAYLIPIGALVACSASAAVWIAGRRDVNASLIADRQRRSARTALLRGPVRLSLRLNRAVLGAWTLSLVLSGLLMGLIAKSVGDALGTDAAERRTFARLGYHGSGALLYLGVAFLLIATLLTFVSAGQVGHILSEEASGRLENLLDRPLSRTRWLTWRLAVSSCFVLVAGLLAGLVTWAGAAAQDSQVALGSLVGAGLNVVPAGLLVLGLGTFAYGLLPRAANVVTYGVVAWSFLVQILGGAVRASHWILDMSIFHQTAAAPAVAPDWASWAFMVLLAMAFMTSGVMAFRRRDLVAD